MGNPKGKYGIEVKDHEQVHAIIALGGGFFFDNRVGEHVETESEPFRKEHFDAPNQVPPSPPLQPFRLYSSLPPTPPNFPMIPSPPATSILKAPFPQCLENPTPFGKKGQKIKDMMEMFWQVKINLPLLDSIAQILAYANFLKDLSTHK
jgi:hypothetical protein